MTRYDTVEVETTLTDGMPVLAVGQYIPFCRGDGPDAYYGPTPDEPECIEDLQLFFVPKGRSRKRYPFTRDISDAEYDRLEIKLLEYVR